VQSPKSFSVSGIERSHPLLVTMLQSLYPLACVAVPKIPQNSENEAARRKISNFAILTKKGAPAKLSF